MNRNKRQIEEQCDKSKGFQGKASFAKFSMAES